MNNLYSALPDNFSYIGPVAPVHLFFGQTLEDKMNVIGVIPAEQDFIAGVKYMYYRNFSQHGNPPHP
jgi:hypothetical protein